MLPVLNLCEQHHSLEVQLSHLQLTEILTEISLWMLQLY